VSNEVRTASDEEMGREGRGESLEESSSIDSCGRPATFEAV
jgi:hypothetical protein